MLSDIGMYATMEQEPKETRTFSVRFPAEVLEQVEEIAKRETRSVNQQLLHIVKQWIEEHWKD